MGKLLWYDVFVKHFRIVRIRKTPNPTAFAWEFGVPPNELRLHDYWLGKKKPIGGYEFFVLVGSMEFGWVFDIRENDLITLGKKADKSFRQSYRVVDLDEHYLLLKAYEEKEGPQKGSYIEASQTSDT